MSGHSKWSTIKRKKEITDAKKGQLFSKLSKLIEIAAKKGSDPKTNFSLKAVVDKAKASNMPVANIEKAIKKGSGLGGNASSLEEILYEVYGPGGVAILITGVTDNKNRTTSDIKHILTQHEASLSGSGSVKWLFESKYEDGNIVWIAKQTIKLNDVDENKLENLMEELDDQEDVAEVYTNAE
ncbi:MAG: YebC/PmpR family DNA-binding transcriptional regulator [Patescibacteria group bacterium]